MTKEQLIQNIQDVIKTNGNNEITGALLQITLIYIVEFIDQSEEIDDALQAALTSLNNALNSALEDIGVKQDEVEQLIENATNIMQSANKALINVSQYNNKYDYADVTAARNAVPVSLRALGQLVCYKLSSGVWGFDKYIGTDVSGWVTLTNWAIVGGVSQAQFDMAINSITAALPEGDLILTIPTWTQGGLNSDGTVNPSNNIIHSDYIGIGSYIKKVNFMSGYQLSILEYNSAGTQLQYTVLTEPAVNGFTLLTNTDKIRLVYQKTPTGTTPPSVGANVSFGLGDMNFGVWQRGIPTEPTLYSRIYGQQAYVNARSLRVTFPSNCICYIWEVTATGTTSYKTLTASTDNHALNTNTIKVYPVFGLSTGGTIDTSFAKYLTVKENLSQSFGQAISRSEVEELLQDVGTSANSNGILLFKGHDIFDYSGKFPMVDITNATRDKSFPVCISKGNQVILNYIDRENHNSTVTNNVVRVSNDGGLTFSGELILNDLKLTAGVRLKGKNKILASKIYFNNPSDPIMTKPVIADFETLISSNFTSGFEIKDALVIDGFGTAELVMSSAPIEHKGILYWAGYRDTIRTTGANNAQAALFKSLDYGETWVFVSFVPQKPTNEFAICFVGDRLIGSTRVSNGTDVNTQNNWVFYSDDFGVTWTSLRLNINIHNPYMFAWNGHPVLAGRLIMTDYPRAFAFIVLNTDGTIKSVIIFDKQSIASLSYHQGYMIAGEYLRVFGHLYTDTTNNHSKIFRMDIPLNVLNSVTNFGAYF